VEAQVDHPAIEIQAAVPGDAEAVVVMYSWLFAPPGAEPPGWDEKRAAEVCRRVISSPDSDALIAWQAGERVGLCTVYLDIESVRFGQRAWVEDLAVHPRYRSLGVGKSLLDSAKAWARARAATHCELDTAEARADSQRFYEREQPSWRSVCYGWLV
jgi:GNAT superfamily N-acetyltransferase